MSKEETFELKPKSMKEMLELRKKSLARVVWAKGGETIKWVVGTDEADPTDRKNEDTGKPYTTDDHIVAVELEGGERGHRKVHITDLMAMIKMADEQGLKSGDLLEYTKPEYEPEDTNRRRR